MIDLSNCVEINTVTANSNAEFVDLSAFSDASTSIFALIIQHLPLKDVAQMARACKKFRLAANDSVVWKRKVHEYGILDTFDNALQSIKEHFIAFYLMPKIYPEKVLDAFGGAVKVFLLPTLDIGTNTGRTGYLDFITPSMMKGHKIMRGVDAAKRSFISICATITSPETRSRWHNSTNVQTFFQRYTESKNTWVCGGEELISFPDTLSEETYTCIAQLVQGGTCQNQIFGVDCTVTLTDGVEPKAPPLPALQSIVTEEQD